MSKSFRFASSQTPLRLYERRNCVYAVCLETGDTGWLAAGEQRAFKNAGNSAVELLRFEMKTKPVKSDPNKKEQHAHSHD